MEIPKAIGRFAVDRQLGTGTFSTVYLARDPDLETPVAVKVLTERWAGNDEAKRRFIDEAKALRVLPNDRIVEVYEVGRLEDGRPFMVMEFADRGTLKDRVGVLARSAGRYSVEEAVRISVEIAECLGSVHAMSYVHRDLKPSNVLYGSAAPEPESGAAREHMLLGDFGVARLEGTAGEPEVVGSPDYMAPEQALPETAAAVDHRADLYAAATILYELLAGHVPFQMDPKETMRAKQRQAPPPLAEARPDAPPALCAVVHKGLARDPNWRYASAWEWKHALLEALQRPAGGVGPGSAELAPAPLSPYPTGRPYAVHYSGPSGPPPPPGPGQYGTPPPGPGQYGAPPPPPPLGSAVFGRFDPAVVMGVGGVILFIGSLLRWTKVSVPRVSDVPATTLSASGLTAHAFPFGIGGWLCFLGALVLIGAALLARRPALLPRARPSAVPAAVVAVVLALLITFFSMLAPPGKGQLLSGYLSAHNFAVNAHNLDIIGPKSAKSAGIGVFLALIGAVVAALGVFPLGRTDPGVKRMLSPATYRTRLSAIGRAVRAPSSGTPPPAGPPSPQPPPGPPGPPGPVPPAPGPIPPQPPEPPREGEETLG